MRNNILLLTIIAILSITGFGQNKSFEDLTFSLTALKPQVLPLEPIPFKLTLRNSTDMPVTMDTSLSFQLPSVSLEIRAPNGKTLVPPQLSHLNGRTVVFSKEIPPGESVEETEVFEFKTQTYFGRIGDYQVRASFKNSAGRLVRSGWVDLSVAEPVGTDKAAYEYVRKKLDRSFIPFTSWSTDELEEFVLYYSGSAYENYARYRLGERYFEKEKEKAEVQFRRIQDSTFFYAQDVNEKLKKLEHQLKKEN